MTRIYPNFTNYNYCNEENNKILFKDESYKIIGACMKVHSELGPGFLESVYQEALEREFSDSKIPFLKEVKMEIFYGDKKLKKYFKADFLCYNKIIIELKSVSFIPAAHSAQVKNYLVATKKELGILVNFGTPSLTYKRILNKI